ncbi:hypothetical protein BLX87_10205 [Bacillus sp. VT-16-64]|nr:hypothetical protein BLX87_10205 [Bacillus sp. VT-16-64]
MTYDKVKKHNTYKIVFFTILLSLFAQIMFVQQNEANAAKNENSRAEYLGMKLYRGEIHAHTSISDGVEFPKDAFEYVQKHTNHDFFGTTEHDVTFDISSGNDYLKRYQDSYSEEYKLTRKQHDDYNTDQFVTVPGIEVTWYDNAGHINLFNTEWFPRTYGKGATGQFGMGVLRYDLPTFYGRLSEDPDAIAQFNHPDAMRKGDFFGFKHITKEVDDRISLFEYKVSRYFNTYIQALDNGWHVSPTYSGDEHQANWAAHHPGLTGLWTEELTREGIYDALKNRRTYSSFDENFDLKYSANKKMMGSILPKDTKELDIHIDLLDPDKEDHIEKVTIYKNNGEIVKEYTDINSNTFTVDETVSSKNGEYFLVRVFQKDQDEIISAPIWIGEETAGTDYAPEITVEKELPGTVKLGDTVTIPNAAATDDSGENPSVKVEVFDSKGFVEVNDNRFTIKEYGEYFVRYYATDSNGNSRVKIERMVVDDKELDADKLLQEFSPVVHVGETDDAVGLNLVTDKVVKQSYVQYKEASETDWKKAKVVQADVSYFESAYGKDIDNSNYRILASHEANIDKLKKGTKYEYRYGVSKNGPWGPVHSFETVPDSDDTTIYVMGDLQVPDRNPESFSLFTDTLKMIRGKNPDGKLMLQVGDLVDKGGRADFWSDVFDHVYKDFDLLSANMAGNHEFMQDADASSFAHYFNTPKNGKGTFPETNYSFDYGDAHIAVINSMDLNKEQLKWLEEDMRSTDKKWKIVTGHFSYFGGSHSDDPGMSTDRALMSKKLQQLGVQLYIGGHDHVYKRSTIRDGKMDNSQEAMNLGTTHITMGSSGPKYYDNEAYFWDHIVYDENVPTGMILEANGESLTVKAYNQAGDTIDEFTIQQAENHIELSSVDVENGMFKGVGLLNHPGSLDKVTVIAAKYDQSGKKLLDSQIKEVELEQKGREQVIRFDEPMKFTDQNTVRLFVWDHFSNQRPVVPSMVVREAMEGEGTAENPYKIDSLEDMKKMAYYPDRHYVMTADIDGEGQSLQAIGSGDSPFSGVFDGNGHSITNVKITTPSGDQGAGLFNVNNGTIKNVAVLKANIDIHSNDIGILVDVNNGTVENSYTTGKITGQSNVGGLVGFSNGTIRNSYSTATVKAKEKQAGGLVGITNYFSLTENSYATGSVTAGSSNAGGISGYGYNDTTIQNNFAFNTSVITTSAANRIVGRIRSDQQAVLENNYAYDNMMVSKEGITKEEANNEKGLGKSREQMADQATFEKGLGWDFDHVWIWDEGAQRPLLKNNQEKVNENTEEPSLEKDENGSYIITSVQDLQMINLFPKADYILQNDLDFSGHTFTTLNIDSPFLGTFDGNGKIIKNMESKTGALFHLNGGTITNVGIENANVIGEEGAPQTGILVNVNNGTVENTYTTGKVVGKNTVGGIVGYSNATIRNSYSTADVTAQVSQAGGIVGITNGGSLTENVFATGAITAGTSNAGGITGYGYNGTIVRNTAALNKSITTNSRANRIVGRIYKGHIAVLENNLSYQGISMENEYVTTDSLTNERGLGKTKEEIENKDTYIQALGWDFASIWKWDPQNNRPALAFNEVTEEQPGEDVEEEPGEEAEGPALQKDDNGFYMIETIEDLQELNQFPNEQYKLNKDLDFSNVANAAPLNSSNAFTGVFDGNGKKILHYTSKQGAFMDQNKGTIKNMGVVDAKVEAAGDNIGILINVNDGVIENSFTTGEVTGNSNVGGLVGYSNGQIRNSYSTAHVKATSKQAGGLVGITNTESITENSYAAGSVSAGSSNAGGISGYGYNETTLQNSVALNDMVNTISYANRIVGRVKAGHTATLVNNVANHHMTVSKEGVTNEAANNEKGLGKSIEQLASQPLYENELGWDFNGTWTWDDVAKRPLLVANKEYIDPNSHPQRPSLEQNEDGYYMIKTAADFQVLNQFPNEKYIVNNDLDFTGQSFTVEKPFMGELNGNNKTIRHFHSNVGGLFQLNGGTIKNIGMIDAKVVGEKGAAQAGMVVNLNNGIVENVFSTGSITGDNTVGGIVGYSNGVIKNSYSHADVTANVSQAGGVVGITNAGSVTEKVYAAGSVTAKKSNAGGITGYGYNGTVVKSAIALNPSVTAGSHANRIVGRVFKGHTATLTNNFAVADMTVDQEAVTTESPTNEKGQSIDREGLASKTIYEETLEWDFQHVWHWDENRQLPVLKY